MHSRFCQTIAEAAEAPMTTEMREGAVKLVTEALKKLETAAGELKLTRSAALMLFATSAVVPASSSAPDSAINRLSDDRISGIKEKKKYWSDMKLCDKYAKDLTEDSWIVTCIPCSQAKQRNRGIINMRRTFSKYNWNNHCLCNQHLNTVANLIAYEETRGKQNQKRKSQRGLTTFFEKEVTKNEYNQLLQRLLHFLIWVITLI